MRLLKPGIALLFLLIFFHPTIFGQACTTLGQTPSTAFPVCGTGTFTQNTVPLCATNDMYVRGCSENDNANYQNKNPYFYKFTCFVSGTLGFVITPLAPNEDYDWQLYDITGHNPDDIFTDHSLIVTGNWSGVYGPTGASATGTDYHTIECASDPNGGESTFSSYPPLIAGHEYLLMVSHFTDTQSGYTLSFGGGNGVITDTLQPHMLTAIPNCNGKEIVLRLNKRMKCTSLTPDGSEFSFIPALATVTTAVASQCSAGFDFDTVLLTLSNPLPSNNYQLVINHGSDGNTLKDICDEEIPPGETTSFSYIVPQPTPIDSLGKIPCSPDTILAYFDKPIDCSSIAADGSDFTITGPTPVTVASAYGHCVNGYSNVVVVKLSAPIYTKGTYLLRIKPGVDGGTVTDICGQQTIPQSISFTTADTVSADFTYASILSCRINTLVFAHNGAHDVNSWTWVFNHSDTSRIQNPSMAFPATSTDTIELTVTNGVCSDTASKIVVLNNEVKALFDMPTIICPTNLLSVTNNSLGHIDSWIWKYDVIGINTVKDPLPVHLPDNNNREIYYSVKLTVTNTSLNCSDSLKKTVRVLNNCFIAVPTAFTPNGDGLNDFLYPHNAIKADNLDFKVFNRWGQMVFATHSWLEKWDGKLKGTPQNPGVYVWFLSYTNHDTGEKVFQKGTTMLIR